MVSPELPLIIAALLDTRPARPAVRVCTGVKQEFNSRVVLVHCRNLNRRYTPISAYIKTGALLDEQPHHFVVPLLCRCIQCRSSTWTSRINPYAVLKQFHYLFYVASTGSGDKLPIVLDMVPKRQRRKSVREQRRVRDTPLKLDVFYIRRAVQPNAGRNQALFIGADGEIGRVNAVHYHSVAWGRTHYIAPLASIQVYYRESIATFIERPNPVIAAQRGKMRL